MKIRIAHISDLHLTKNQQPIWGVNTSKQFSIVIEKLRNIGNIDCIIVTGDIADDGDTETYYFADKEFEKLGIATYWCYGNHDDIQVMNTLRHTYCKIVKTVNINNYRFLFLNSVVKDELDSKNRSSGLISATEINEMRLLLGDSHLPTIIAMHHPSLEPGGWLSDKILINRGVVNDIVSSNNVILVLSGHVHYFFVKKVGNTIFSSASAVGFAFDKDLGRFEIAEGQEGFSLIDIDDDIIIRDIKL